MGFQVVHGDLAARNILVFQRNTVKITDFGLSKLLEGGALYAKKRKVLIYRRKVSQCRHIAKSNLR